MAHIRRSRTRRSLLPALLLGALGLFTAASAAAQVTVSLSASPDPVTEGSPVTVTATMSETLTFNMFFSVTLADDTAEPEDHETLLGITVLRNTLSGSSTVQTYPDTDTDDETFTVTLRPLSAPFQAGTDSVTVTIKDVGNQPPPPVTPSVSLSAYPNPVTEGSPVTVTATLSAALSGNVTIPLTLTDGSAEPADYGTLASITITAGARSGTGTIATNHDSDTADETFTVALGSLPAEVAAGSPSSVQVGIRDDDDDGGGSVTVSLSAYPNPVTEGFAGDGDGDAVGVA